MRLKTVWTPTIAPILAAATLVAICFSTVLAEPAPAVAQAPAKKDKPEFPEFSEAMKGFEQVPTAETPFLTLWYNKKEDSLRAQIPVSLIGNQFLVATSMSGGSVATGFQLDHFLAYFERMKKKLVLMRVDPRYVEGGDKPIADVIKRSYGGDVILKAIDIITMKGNDPVVDLDGLFKADFFGISRFGGGTVDPGLSKWAEYKAFPENVELTADLAMMRSGTGRRNLFHYSLSKIPASAKGYKPRIADDRVGYFMTVRKDWSKEHNARTLFDRYINRWQLEKRDPSLEFSAPKHPIVWYIEKTVPLEYRRWVKEGILEWNKAFKKCGFLDAVEVIQQEDYDPRTKDLDPEDVRYNFFRWIVTGRAFAMGPSRAHPLTGQIFDADVVCDDSMIRSYVEDYERLTGGSDAWEAYNPVLDDFFQSNPFWAYRSPIDHLLPNVKIQDDPDVEFYRNLKRYMYEKGHPLCECAAGMARQMQFARIALEAKGIFPDSDEFMGQVIKEIVMHEVGHCLGLRHNFKASTWLPIEEIAEQDRDNDPSVASVMDYNPLIVAPRGEKQGSFTTRSIGPYDYWAIEYGYRPVDKPYKDEKEMLKAITGRCAEAGLDYATDDDTMSFLSPDPLSNRFDLGRDVLEYAERQIKLADSLMEDIKDWAVKDGESYNRLRRAFTIMFSQRAMASAFVARFPGGQIINRDHKGDPDERAPVTVVDAKKQRRAVQFICDSVFAEDAYKIDPDLLSHLAPGRFGHWGSDEYDFLVDFNIHEFVARNQYHCLITMMNPFTIRRIHDNQVKFADGEAVYTLAEHIRSITDAIWAELDDEDRNGSEQKAFINSFRRDLQRRHLAMLMNMVLSRPGRTVPADAAAISRHIVGLLSKKMTRALKSADLDFASKAHLRDVKKRIDMALEAEYTVVGGDGSPLFREAEGATGEPVFVLPQE